MGGHPLEGPSSASPATTSFSSSTTTSSSVLWTTQRCLNAPGYSENSAEPTLDSVQLRRTSRSQVMPQSARSAEIRSFAFRWRLRCGRSRPSRISFVTSTPRGTWRRRGPVAPKSWVGSLPSSARSSGDTTDSSEACGCATTCPSLRSGSHAGWLQASHVAPGARRVGNSRTGPTPLPRPHALLEHRVRRGKRVKRVLLSR